jgi:phasin family protein
MQQQALQQQATQFLDFYRTGLKNASEMMKASLESVEKVQQQQFQAMRNALEENAKSVNQLADAKSIEEMVAVQTRMAGTQMEQLIGLWTGMWRIAGENQNSMLRQAQSATAGRPQFEAPQPRGEHRKSA